jgi:hypothetical protein
MGMPSGDSAARAPVDLGRGSFGGCGPDCKQDMKTFFATSALCLGIFTPAGTMGMAATTAIKEDRLTAATRAAQGNMMESSATNATHLGNFI